MTDTFATRYQVISSRDPRFDGRFFTAVTSTGIYCRPSCPARTPKPENVLFFTTGAAAQAAGFRACRRCRPEAAPGSPDWDVRADLVARALRLISEGAVDEAGVSGLARRLAVSERHLHRQMSAEVGVGPLALARMRRAQTARMLIEATDLPITQVAFAAGYASVRQFNDSITEAFGCPPSSLRRRGAGESGAGDIVLRLTHRGPYAAAPILDWLGTRAVDGVEERSGGSYRRTVRLPRGTGVVDVTPGIGEDPGEGHALVRLRLEDLRDLSAAVQRCRRQFDLDADPCAVGEVLGADPLLAPMVARHPGLRVPGHVDGFELAVRAVLGQQVTVKGARTLAGRVVARHGDVLATADGGLTHLFPTADRLAGADLEGLGLTGARRRALGALAQAVASGDLVLDAGADRDEAVRGLLALPGIGTWTASYIAMRALGDPDAIPLTDLVLRQALQALGEGAGAREIAERARAWSPWRAYAAMHLWTSFTPAREGGHSNQTGSSSIATS